MENIKPGIMNIFKEEKSEKSENNIEGEVKSNKDLKWYERFGLKSDPFDHRNLSLKVLGHEEEKRKIIEWIKDGRSILLHGATGVGKTNIINEIKEEINDRTIEGMKDFGTMYHTFDVPGDPNHLKSFKKAKGFFGFGRKKVVAFMDEIHFGDEKDVIGISALWDKKDLHSVVFVQINKKPKLDQLIRRIGIYNIELEKIPRSVVVDIIKQRIDNKLIFEPDAVDTIIKLGGENPSVVLQLCGEIASYLAAPQKPITIKDVKEFRFSDIYKMSKDALKSIMTTDALDENARKKAKCSPTQWEIVKNLRTGDMTVAELGRELGKNISKTSMQITRMMNKKQIRITENKKPKVYGLDPEFEREFVLING